MSEKPIRNEELIENVKENLAKKELEFLKKEVILSGYFFFSQ